MKSLLEYFVVKAHADWKEPLYEWEKKSECEYLQPCPNLIKVWQKKPSQKIQNGLLN